MSVKASVSISAQQDAYVRDLVEQGCSGSVGSLRRVHPILFGRTGCRWSKAEANALVAANSARKTTAGAKSSIGGIAAPQSLNQNTWYAPGSPKISERYVAKDMGCGSIVGVFS